MKNKNTWENRLSWSDELTTGNEEIDEQHKTIFNITNIFIDAYLKNEGKEILGDMLVFLIGYAVDHFVYEEKLMLETNYPNYERHKKSHEDFKIGINELKDEFDSCGASDDLAKNLSGTVIRWLVTHIQHEDFKIAKHIRKEQHKA